MSRITLWARRGVIEPHWQLGDLGADADADAMMLGWEAPDSVDGGVPAPVVAAWAQALAAVARVTFLCSESKPSSASTEWIASGNGTDFNRAAPSRSFLSAPIGRLRGQRGRATLVCSQHAATITRAFGDATFAWWLQSQVLLLSARDALPPPIAPDTALALIGDDWATRARALRDRGVLAVARPGVDGDLLGLLMLDHDIGKRLLAALTLACRECGLDWVSPG